MSSQLQNIADIITDAAAWKRSTADENGVHHFALEGDLDFQLFTPDNRSVILLATLGDAPDAGGINGDDELKRLASVAAASLKKRRSSFAIAGQKLELSRVFPITESDVATIRLLVRDFINDLAWWKQQVKSGSSESTRSASNSPFSLDGWFSGF